VPKIAANLRRLVAIALTLGLLVFAREPLLRSVGHMLITDEPLAYSDLIIVPNWTGTPGAIEASDLVHQGVADRVAVLMDQSTRADAELVRRGILKEGENWLVDLLWSLGVGDVLIIPDTGNGTSAEALLLPAWFAQNQIHSVIVISTPDHSRRLFRLLRRSFDKKRVRATVRMTRYSEFDPETWWQSRSGIRTGIEELQKLLLDYIRHPLS